MARLAGVDLPRNKRIDIALTYIYGIGRKMAVKILEEARVEPSTRSDDLTENQVADIRQIIDTKHKVEGDLRKEISMNIKRYMDLGSYIGLRHRRNMPCHGQRTHTNARTRKGPRRILGRKK